MVLVIIAVVAGIAAPRLANAAANQRAQAAAQRVAADLELARERAKASSAVYAVSFDLPTQTYKLGTGNSSDTVDLSRSPYQTQRMTADFSGRAVVSFNAFGVPDSGGSVGVQGGTTSYTVTLAAESGEVTVQ